jgi:hypothetical protein
MRATSTYLAALAELHLVDDGEERRRLWRQGLAAMVARAEKGPAPLEGLDPAGLLASTRVALGDGLLRDLDWLSPPAAAIAQLELASALPDGPERRELGRRVIGRLRDGDRETFLVLATALALSSPRALETAAVRSRLEVVLAAPLAAPGGVGAIAFALLARGELADKWLVTPSTRALPDRRLAARLLAHGAREAVRRGGDNAELFAEPAIAGAFARLLGDREMHVWRFAAVARGLLCHARPETAAEVDNDLRSGPSVRGDRSSDLRRAGTSAAAALERGGLAQRWRASLFAHAERDGAIARAVIQGLAGLTVTDPPTADEIAAHMVTCGGLDAIEALADLVREEGDPALPAARAAARVWLDNVLAADAPAARLRTQKLASVTPADDANQPITGPMRPIRGAGGDADDEGRVALLHLMRGELTGAAADGLGAHLARVRADLDAGRLPSAIKAARDALDEVAASVEWLERSTDDDPVDRRHAVRVLRELDREILSDGTLGAAFALVGDGDPAPRQLAGLIARLEDAVLDRERDPETRSAVPDYRLRLARLRALVRVLDGDTANADRLERRIQNLRALMTRALVDRSPLRRAVWAAMTRTWDALLRADDVEVSDLLLILTSSFDPDEDFAIVREATMVPDVEQALDAYRAVLRATWAAADPDDAPAVLAAVDALAALPRALPRAMSPRVEAVRRALDDLAVRLDALVRAGGLSDVPASALDGLAPPIAALGLARAGARRKVGLAAEPELAITEALRHAGVAVERVATGGDRRTVTAAGSGEIDACDYEIATAIEAARGALPPAIGEVVGRVLTRLARLPVRGDRPLAMTPREAELPAWLPLSRVMGGFRVERPIGTGGGGSVFVAIRSDERGRHDAVPVALKVPDYDGAAARSLSELEFESMFRDEAGALLSLPRHPNLAGFVTFDAGARPKPILVMELVPGATLERALERGFDAATALAVVDGIAAGLEAMHAARVAHLDIKPQNVILRDDAHGRPVLVDFGLAGRKLRPGCGSPHYGAPEVWAQKTHGDGEPFSADVYAFSCLAFEVMTNQVLCDGASLQQVLNLHLGGQAVARSTRVLGARRELAELGAMLAAGLSYDPMRRPTISRLRAGFAAIAPNIQRLRWPLA